MRRRGFISVFERTFLHLAAGAAALLVMSRAVGAQAYPSRPVRIIVGFPAGGAQDIVARLIGQWLAERLGQSRMHLPMAIRCFWSACQMRSTLR